MIPLVSCICPTTLSRKRFWPDILRCFSAQTYPNKELVLVVDNVLEADALLSMIPRGTVIVIDDWASLGDKRNAGCEFARGSIIAHLDDDNLYAPGHLAHLVEDLTTSGKAVAGYTSTIMREMRRVTVGGKETSGWWMLRTEIMPLAYRRDWWMDHRFESINVGEDNTFVAEAEKRGQTVDAGDGHLYHCIRNHAGCVSGRVVIEGPDCRELPDGGEFERIETA
jgi:glycosyltransferase involved in cell wall biosynthesis